MLVCPNVFVFINIRALKWLTGPNKNTGWFLSLTYRNRKKIFIDKRRQEKIILRDLAECKVTSQLFLKMLVDDCTTVRVVTG